ncbi:Ca2+ transporter [Tolypocladium capitatum]|uniref:Ca2+ transporter n=1 Tax=Tolypocladium capitatum TaxID=45235 RepID=A0A2K3QJG0_9HYPO|nr:Ca2+ transporter [Tolypocladium capitatum]
MEAAPSASVRCDAQSDDFNHVAGGDDDDCPDSEGASLLSVGLPEDASVSAGPQAGTKGGIRTLLTAPSRDGIERILRLWPHMVEKLSWSRAARFDALHELDGPDMANQESRQRGSIVGPLADILFASWLNFLLVFVPIGLGSYVARGSPVLIFSSNAIAIVPLSAILTDATERIAAHAGDTVGALLNITMGNLVELILLVALANNHVRIVQASILGSIIVNLLLFLGSALLAGSVVNGEPTFNGAEARLLACLLFVSVFTLLMPTAFDYTYDPAKGTSASSLKMSRISSLLVLAIYVVYFVYEVRSHSDGPGEATSGREFDLESNTSGMDQQPQLPPPPPPLPRSGSQTLPPRTIRFADESLGGPVSHKPGNRIRLGAMNPMESDDYGGEYRGRRSGDSDSARSRPTSHQPLLRSRKHSRSLSLTSSRGRLSRESSLSRDMTRGFSRAGLTTLQMLRDGRLDREQSADRQSADFSAFGEMVVSLGVLIVTSGLMSVNAELLVSAIDDVTHQTDLSDSVIGLIILPIAGNMAEYATVVAVAARDKMDLAIAVAVGSSIQIALCVAPLTVIAGWILHRDLALTFNFFELATLLGGVLLVNLLILNESSSSLRASGLKGALMCACYVIIV